MTIAITTSGITLDGPLVAGEKVAVAVSGLSLAAEDKPTLALLARFPDALLASVELTESETAGTWTGELDTATKQTSLFFATARADERRDAALELVSGRVSLARLTVPMANSALCPKPDGSPFASPVYVPVPGPPGQGGDPYDQAPEMDGEASAGAADEYARGDHVHPTDSSRASAADVTAIQGIIPATASTSNKLATASDLSGKANDADVVKLTGNQTVTGDKTFTGQVSAADVITGFSYGFPGGKYISTPEKTGNALTDTEISDSTTSLGAALAAKADSSSLATVATTGDYGDLLNKPTIPAAQVNADWDAASGVAQILNKPVIPDVSGKADAVSIAPAFSTSSTYAVGDYCTYQGQLYKCATAVSTAGEWDAANWTAVAVTDEMGGGGESNVIDAVKVNGVALTPDANKAVNIVKKVWAASATYASATGWTITPEGSGFSLADGDVVFFIASNSATNNVKANVGGSGAINIVKAADVNHPNVTQGDWSTGDIVVLQYSGKKSLWVLLGAKKAPLESPNFTGTPTAPTAAAGTNTKQVATTAFVHTAVAGKADAAALRYSLAAATSVSDATSTAVLQDRAVNTVSVGSAVTTLNLTFPSAVAGYARDFFLRLDCAGTALATIALPSGETVDFGADALAGLTGKAGVHLALFTEIAANHWLISAKEAES